MAIASKLRNLLTLVACLWIAPAPAALGFSDTENHWAGTCIEKLQERQLVSGYPDGTFRPNSTITRTEFAVLMLNTFPQAEQKRNPIAFKDVAESYWGYNAVRDAYRKAFFSGYPDGTFKPRLPIPRVQALTVLANGLDDDMPENPEEILGEYFNDAAAIPNYAKGAIAKAAILRLSVNYPNARQLEPNQNATRADVAAFICQALNLPRTLPTEYIAANQPLAIPPEMGGFNYPFSEGLAPAEIDGKYGYVDASGEFAIAPQFDGASPFAEGLAAVKVGDEWGYINKNGQTAIAPQFEVADIFSEGLAAVTLGGKTGFIDKQGNLVIELTLEGVSPLLPETETASSIAVRPFSEGLALVNINNWKHTGFIDKTGKFAIPPQEDISFYSDFSEGMAVISRKKSQYESQYGYIDKTGQIVIEPQFRYARSFAEGIAPAIVGANFKWGYIDKTGKTVIEPQFDSARPFSEGLAAVNIKGKWGFIDKNGSLVIAEQFYAPSHSGLDGVEPFFGGLAIARLGEKAGFIDKTGKIVIEPQFADARSFSDGLALVNLGGEWEYTVGYDGTASPVTSVEFVGGKWAYVLAPK